MFKQSDYDDRTRTTYFVRNKNKTQHQCTSINWIIIWQINKSYTMSHMYIYICIIIYKTIVYCIHTQIFTVHISEWWHQTLEYVCQEHFGLDPSWPDQSNISNQRPTLARVRLCPPVVVPSLACRDLASSTNEAWCSLKRLSMSCLSRSCSD